MMTQDPYRRGPGHALANLVEAGRDLVHGAAGTRPGSRRRRNLGGINQVSRWVGEGINWLLEEDPNGLAEEVPSWPEPQAPGHGQRSGTTGRVASDASGMGSPWANQGKDGSRRRPLQVIPHPAPPLLQQAEPSPYQSGSPRRDGSGRLSRPRPRPRSSRRIQP